MDAIRFLSRALGVIGLVAVVLVPRDVLAHCDGMDGPVVKAAQKAFATGDVNLVLVWVQPADEPEIRRAFNHAVAVRKLNKDARALADQWFFETLVRLHRAGEGAPYTGLKPAGRDLGPAIPMADRALESGNADSLIAFMTDALRRGLSREFKRARRTRDYPAADVAAGREHVAAYVAFVHYVERAYEAATQPVGGHFAEETPAHHER